MQNYCWRTTREEQQKIPQVPKKSTWIKPQTQRKAMDSFCQTETLNEYSSKCYTMDHK